MNIRVRPSELFRGEGTSRTSCAIALAVRRAQPEVAWRWTGFHSTSFIDGDGYAYSAEHTVFGRVLVGVHDLSTHLPWLRLPWLRAVLLPLLWLPVIKMPEATFGAPPDRIIQAPEPLTEPLQIPREAPVFAPPVQLPVEEPVPAI